MGQIKNIKLHIVTDIKDTEMKMFSLLRNFSSVQLSSTVSRCSIQSVYFNTCVERRGKDVRLIDINGKNLGMMPKQEAERIANERSKMLLHIPPNQKNRENVVKM